MGLLKVQGILDDAGILTVFSRDRMLDMQECCQLRVLPVTSF